MSSGIKTKMFGPPMWDSFFWMILGAYPERYDPHDPDHIATRDAFVTIFRGLMYTLPCKFCRDSYVGFYNQLPIGHYTSSRIRLAFWLYLMKDMVNAKLIGQEIETFNKAHRELYEHYAHGRISSKDYSISRDKMHISIMCTIPSPPFEDVLRKYERGRATSCSTQAKKCV